MVEPMNDELLALVEEAREEVVQSALHELSFRTRKKLLLALGPQKLDPRGYGVELLPGKARRLQAALLVCKRVAHAWKRDYGTDAVENLLELIEGYSMGRVGLPEIDAPVDSLIGGLLNGPQGKSSAYLAGQAVAATGIVALGDETLVPDEGVTQQELYAPEDPDLWDAAYWAAGSAAGGMPWEGSFSGQAYGEFWKWYVEDVIPEAWSVR